jgi:hypothetical protein
MATLTAVASPEEDENMRPLPWRRMAWVTWRQHRAALTGVASFVALLSLGVWISGLHLHDLYGQALACRPAGDVACSDVIASFNGAGGFLANGLILQVVPALIGVFIGAPVLAREMETGTFRYAWTQGYGRIRWALAKLVALAIVVTAVAAALSVLFSWYYQPYFAANDQKLGLNQLSQFAPGLFDLREVALVGWTLVAFAIGAAAGMLIRRVVPAIAASLAAFAGLAFLAGGILREHYLAPIVTSKLNVFPPAWILNRQWMKAGRLVSQSTLSQVLQGGPAQLQGKGGVPQSLDSWRYLAHHGFTQWTTYQPTNRFWPFQWIEGGWLLALSGLLIAATIWLVRRRAV